MSFLTFQYRVKDATVGKHLQRMAGSVNRVWNFCNETALLVWRKERRFISAFELITLCAGAGQELGLLSETIHEICLQYAKSRHQHKRIKLRWRTQKRSLGWVPFTGRSIKVAHGQILLKKRQIRFWQSRAIQGVIKTGSFVQNGAGQWYVNFQCEVEDSGTPTGDADIGIDLGLKDQVSCSDGVKYSRDNLTQKHAEDLAMAQRAHKKRRLKAIAGKINNQRKDWAHKTTTTITQRARTIVVGNLSPLRFVKTNLAKSIYDAGWSQLRAMLAYKAMRLGIAYHEVSEYGSTVTCSGCGSHTGPSGLSNLDIRVWCCSNCGTVHDRDTNAAHNILLRLGRETPSGSS